MPGPIVVDARLLHVNRTGIGRYLRHLYEAMAKDGAGTAAAPGRAVDGEGGGGDGATSVSGGHEQGPLDRNVIVLYHRKDRARALQKWWPCSAVAWTPPHHPWERWTLAAEVARLRPALLHSPDHVCPQPAGWQTVVTVHDLAFHRLPETHSPASRRYYGGLARSVRQAARVICVSEATRCDLLTFCDVDAGKVRVVHEAPDPLYAAAAAGVSSSSAVGEVAAAAGASVDGRPYFVFVGTIEPRKNVAGAIRALARIACPGGAGPAASAPVLLVVGAGGYGAAEVYALPRTLGIERNVTFLGPQPARVVAQLYRQALALVYPSFLEGFGLPILEAMASGTPVITSNRSSMAEVAGGAAALVDPDDIGSIGEAMRRVWEDEAYRDTLRRAGTIHVGQFSWRRAARETLAVFREALVR